LLDKEQRRLIGDQDMTWADQQRTDHLADAAACSTLESNLIFAANFSASSAALAIGNEARRPGDDGLKVWQAEEQKQIDLLRDLFGNPFRPVTINPSLLVWNDTTVVKLAEGIYKARAFDHLPVLADALDDAGCDNLDILNHCRQPAEHARGCWVVDLLLGKK
jgi:hypothetical protein